MLELGTVRLVVASERTDSTSSLIVEAIGSCSNITKFTS